MSLLRNVFLRLFVLLAGRYPDPIVRHETDDMYDFIVVGSGPGGATVASRLSEMPNMKILLLEAGQSDLEDPRISIPTRAYELVQTDNDWQYNSEPISNPPYGERVFNIPRGKTLGGTSSINYNAYVRGSPHDYDSWEDFGAEGWGWADVEPYFRDVENATLDEMSQNLGRNGFLKLIKNHQKPSKAWTLFQNAAAEVGIKTADYTDDMDGVISPMTFTIDEGLRQNSVTAYVRPIHEKRKDRLHVVTGALVSKVLFQENSPVGPIAYGVKYLKDGKYHTVQARKEVILSAGAIGTPQILLLSGIGPKEDLQNLGIPVLKDLPGVGSNMQNHWSIGFAFNTNLTNPLPAENSLVQYIVDGDGPMSMFPYTTIFTKTPLSGTSASLSSEKRPFPDLQLYLYENPELPIFLFAAVLLHPKSRGSIKLRTRDIQDNPIINSNFLEHEDDLLVMTEALRLMEQFEDSSPFKKAAAKMIIPEDCINTEKGNMTRDDNFYGCLIWKTSDAGNHQCCTAKMGSPSDQHAVVDSQLRVHGVRNLRVVDASVFPHQISANAQATVYMVGERAADMIKQGWLQFGK